MGSIITAESLNSPFANVLQYYVFSPITAWSAIVLSVAFIIHMLTCLCRPGGSPPKFYYRASDFSRYLQKRVSLKLWSSYTPPIWARHSFVQTLFPLDPFQWISVFLEREYLQVKDRGLVALDWALPSRSLDTIIHFRDNTTVLIIIPDMLSTPRSFCTLCREILVRGIRPVIFNRRGQGGCPLTTSALQCYGDSSDLRQAVQMIHHNFPTAKLTAVGYGSGADLLLSYLGDYGASSLLIAGTAISPLYDPSQLYYVDISKVYTEYRLFRLRRFLKPHKESLEGTIDFEAAMNSKTLKEFDRKVFWEMSNTDDEEGYWEQNCPLRDVDDIATPLLCINSLDDPYVSEDAIPYNIFQLYPHLILAVTDHGGHCGFIQPGNSISWAESLALDFLNTTIDFTKSERKRQKTPSL